MAKSYEEAWALAEFPEHSKVVDGQVGGVTEYVLQEIDSYCIVDKDGNKVWLNIQGNMHRLLGPATHINGKKKNAWAVDGDIIRTWDEYEKAVGDRVPKEHIMMLKLQHGDDQFEFDTDD
ncbi:hypothetical protein RVBP17_2780 [Pseudomonas phage sp. 30-3]|uniref:Uncharacterized protein n=1 Tax=Pseudomonas phage vB_PaeM_PA5oct TaxID=2163605 RepID=A0A4Y1LV65_9CAUD|nr:hypothetical protein PQE65_gp114 [Pseudomonas phage vB_PaeM_PA5oct]WMI31913.1 hypothetical protein GBBBJNDB_00210 [Pseudomonas phage Callisto]VOH54918.1 hypothetical protein MIJ3_00210 [Pseudomonas phage vB_PaeM_MIJ3]BDR25678.1 hypothetical protein RVBP16_1180 [Pseudomonas phage sp. 30-2]BDR26235.1 hypothetical protein RVBP17_2780 [Pseudomonas phage sp. 30-3]QCG76251.1 hypothetical protein EST35_0371 [Pseudomonas phage vB_PaeM_PA5oct]